MGRYTSVQQTLHQKSEMLFKRASVILNLPESISASGISKKTSSLLQFQYLTLIQSNITSQINPQPFTTFSLQEAHNFSLIVGILLNINDDRHDG